MAMLLVIGPMNLRIGSIEIKFTDKLATSISGLEPYRKYMAFVEKQNKE
jgi:hypothetical protein